MDIDFPSRPYHHGDLRAALLSEAEAMLEREGIQALTLRAAARAAGVSHTAPANHFQDLTGLLSELAAVGYQRLAATLENASAGADSRAALISMGHRYVSFARAHPGLFALMFRSERLDSNRPALREGREATRNALRQAIAARPGGSPAPSQLTQAAQFVAAWSLTHGFAMLLLDGRLNGVLGSLPEGNDADALLDAVLTVSRIGI